MTASLFTTRAIVRPTACPFGFTLRDYYEEP